MAMLLGLFLNPFTVIPATFAYLLLPLGIFTVFGWLISWFIDYGLEYVGQIASSNGWLQFAGVQATLYLVDLTFPVNLFLTLLFLRFTITIVAAYSTLAAGAFLKMLGSMNLLPF